jgi:hypothetical protein
VSEPSDTDWAFAAGFVDGEEPMHSPRKINRERRLAREAMSG